MPAARRSPASTEIHSHGDSADRIELGTPFTSWFINQVVTFSW
jgi:hypothetical protein